jgi:opacity protein-like surface antigen
MRKTLISLLLFLLLIPALAMAAPPRPGAYVSAFIGAGVPSGADANSFDFVTGQPFNDRVEFDPGYYLGATGGYDFGMLRLEGELSYKNSEIKSITSNLDGTRLRNLNGDIGALAFMANGFFDFHNQSIMTPYIGGGVGFASLHLSDTTSGNVIVYGAADDTVFAWQAGAGVEIALNRQVSLDLGYRYFGT